MNDDIREYLEWAVADLCCAIMDANTGMPACALEHVASARKWLEKADAAKAEQRDAA